jgi:lambda family phage tail tape measure protein
MADLTYSIDIETRQALSALDNLRTAILGVVSVAALKSLADFADSVTNIQNRLAGLNPNLEETGRQFAAIAAIAFNTRAPIQAVSDLFNKLMLNADLLGISQRQAANLTETLSKMLALSGMSAAQASAPLLQFGQALATGTFQGDELRSILEGFPILAKAIADGLGVSTGQLKKLGSEGRISALDVVDALEKVKSKVDESFGRMAPTISGSLEQLKTASGVAFSEFEKNTQTGRTTANAIEYIAVQVFKLSQSIDSVIGPIKILVQLLAALAAFTLAGRVLGAFGAAIATTWQALTGIGATFYRVIEAVKDFGSYMAMAGSRLQNFGGAVQMVLMPLGKLFAAIVSIGSAIGTYLGIDWVIEKFKSLSDSNSEAAKEVEEFKKKLAGQTNELSDSAKAAELLKVRAEELAKKLGEFGFTIGKTVNAYREQNRQTLEAKNNMIDMQMQAGKLTGITENQLAVEKAVNDAINQRRTVLIGLKDQIDKLQLDQKLKIGNPAENAGKIKILQQAYSDVRKEGDLYIQSLRETVAKEQILIELQKQKAALISFTNKTELADSQKIRSLQDEIATTLLPTINKQYYALGAAVRDNAQNAIDAENARRRGLGLTAMSAQEESKYWDIAIKGLKQSIPLTEQLNKLKNQQQLNLFQRKAEVDLEKQLLDIRQNQAGLNLDKLAQSYQSIDRSARDAAESELQAYASRQNITRQQIDPAIVKQYYDAATRGSQQLKDAQKQLNDETEKRQFRLVEQKTQVDLEKQLLDIKQSQAALNLGTLEKTYQGIDRAARDAAESELQAYAQRQNISRLQIDPAIVKQYYDAAAKGSQQLKAAQAGLYEQSRQFQTGWKQALTSYVEDATNAAKVAQNVFNKAFQGMEDLLVTFAKTGKFQWKSFVQTLTDELLRSNVRQLLASIFGSAQDGMGGLGKLLGGLSGALGLGKGAVGDSANNPIYAFLVNGGNGIANAVGAVGGSGSRGNNSGGGILDTLGTVVSGIGSAIGGVVGGIADAVGGIFGGGGGGGLISGIASFFGFANGGIIPNNNPVIVGERGPEILAGASGMRVMSNQDAFGGGGNVTYNISAVDAPSFQALIARDPTFIHAVSMQGAKSMGRRY